MTTRPTQRAMWLDAIRTEGDRLAAMPADRLDAPVPSLDDWTVERVVRHVGKVHRWVTHLLAAPADADPDEVARAAPSLPRGTDCLPAYRDALDEMVAALDAADPDQTVASFIGASDVAFWLRRQAHELSVHRVDAADAVHAAGGPSPAPLDPVAAADGVAEWVEVFAGTRHAQNGHGVASGLVGRTVDLVVSGAFHADSGAAPGRWRLSFTDERLDWAPMTAEPTAPATATLIAPAPDLLVTLWRRRPIGTVEVRGDTAVAALLLDVMRF